MTSTTGAIILKITYGYSVQGENDPFIELADKGMAMFGVITTPGTYLVDFIPARKAKLRHPSLWMHVQRDSSTISPRMVPWYRLPPGCKKLSSDVDGIGPEASPICSGASGRIAMASMLNAVHLTLREAAGTAIPSLSSALLEGGVSPEEEDLIMWTSMTVYFGMFDSHHHLSRLDIYS